MMLQARDCVMHMMGVFCMLSSTILIVYCRKRTVQHYSTIREWVVQIATCRTTDEGSWVLPTICFNSRCLVQVSHFTPTDRQLMAVGLNIVYSKEKDWVWHKARHYPIQGDNYHKLWSTHTHTHTPSHTHPTKHTLSHILVQHNKYCASKQSLDSIIFSYSLPEKSRKIWTQSNSFLFVSI